MRSKVVLLLALVMAVVTTALFFQYMKDFQTTTTTVTTTPTVGVVIAVDQIEKNERISAEKIKIVQIQEKNVHPQAIRNMDEVKDKLATSTIIRDEPILSHRIVSEKEETSFVSRKIKEGYRAVSVGVNINQSVTNLIEPEDEVDIILTKRLKANGTEKVLSEIVLKNVRVIAVGRKLVNSEDSEEPYVEYSSVTVELKPVDAITLVRSTEEGNIHFILHQRPVELNEKQNSDQG
jgi:pilus assembly protein CpaB